MFFDTPLNFLSQKLKSHLDKKSQQIKRILTWKNEFQTKKYVNLGNYNLDQWENLSRGKIKLLSVKLL